MQTITISKVANGFLIRSGDDVHIASKIGASLYASTPTVASVIEELLDGDDFERPVLVDPAPVISEQSDVADFLMEQRG